MSILLDVNALTMRFGGLTAVDQVTLQAKEQQITAIIGPNGAGKTTLFNCLTGFYKPTSGSIKLNARAKISPSPWGGVRGGVGVNVLRDAADKAKASPPTQPPAPPQGEGSVQLAGLPAHKIARLGIARTFQNIRLFGAMTALENLLVAQHRHLMKTSLYSIGGLLGFPASKRAEKDAIEKARYWLDRMSLLTAADRPAAELPYGMQRRLEIARAMCSDPCLLCLDEPAAGLNPSESARLREAIGLIREEHKIGVLLIEHNMSVVMGISDYIYVLDYGKRIAGGTPAEISHDPTVIRAYLGEPEVA